MMVAVTLSDDVQNVESVRTDVLSGLWRFYTRNKEVVKEGRRFENLIWRIWAAERIDRTISGVRMAFIFLTITEGEVAFQRSTYHIPPLRARRPPTPPSTPVQSPSNSLPIRIITESELQQALITSPPMPPQVPPPSPAPSVQSFNLMANEKEENVPKAEPPKQRKSAMKQPAAQSDTTGTVSKPKKKAIFKLSPTSSTSSVAQGPARPAMTSGEATLQTAGKSRQIVVERRQRTRTTRARVQKQPQLLSQVGRNNAGRVVASQAMKRSSSARQANEIVQVETTAPSSSVLSGNWIVDPEFRLKFSKRHELLSNRAQVKAPPATPAIQTAAVLITNLSKGERTPTTEKGPAYRDTTEPLKPAAVSDFGTGPSATAGTGSGPISELSLLFQEATSNTSPKKKRGLKERIFSKNDTS